MRANGESWAVPSHLFPTKLLRHQKRYLNHGFFKPQDSKISKFIVCVNHMIKYLKHFPTFGTYQGLPEYEIANLVEFPPPC